MNYIPVVHRLPALSLLAPTEYTGSTSYRQIDILKLREFEVREIAFYPQIYLGDKLLGQE